MDRTIAVWKEKGPTSHDVVDEIRKVTGERKVGHAGTLDPLASGVLVVGIGRQATKKLGDIVKKEKEYIATIRLGKTSTTDDEEGEKQETSNKAQATREEVDESIRQFVGKINQLPPVYSAIKVGGKKAYEEARKGKPIDLEKREVEVKKIEVIDYNWPILKIKVVTGPGVYVRSLARDIGKILGVGGYLADLERTRVGEYTKEKSVTIKELRN